jgi:hypothetical protein
VPAAAPTIDDRLLRFIHGSPPDDSPAELTRAVGALAWELGLVRPSYETVRLIAQGRRRVRRPRPRAMPRRPPISVAALLRVLDTLYEYPAPGLGRWYERYRRGAG